VPALAFGPDFIIESNVIAEFVADLFPNARLRPEGHSAEAALKAAKMRFFTEVWQSKVQALIFAPFFGPGDDEAPSKIVEGVRWALCSWKGILHGRCFGSLFRLETVCLCKGWALWQGIVWSIAGYQKG